MAEWGLDPNYILDNWTDDQLMLYVIKHGERVRPRSESEGESETDYEKASLERFQAWKQQQSQKALCP